MKVHSVSQNRPEQTNKPGGRWCALCRFNLMFVLQRQNKTGIKMAGKHENLSGISLCQCGGSGYGSEFEKYAEYVP